MTTRLCVGCGRQTKYAILCASCLTIVSNLRQKYVKKIAHVTDAELARRYDDYNLSDKSEPEIVWLVKKGIMKKEG